MSLVKCKDNRTGITYVYESQSYWDKEKQQPRAHRKLIGKLDEATGEIVPTDGRGRKRKDQQEKKTVVTTPDEDKLRTLIEEKNQEIIRLKSEILRYEKERTLLKKQLQKLADSIAE